MKRVKKQKQKSKKEIVAESADFFDKIGGKQVIGHCRIVHADGTAENVYTTEDNKKVMEDDKGKAIKKMKKQVKRNARLAKEQKEQEKNEKR